MVRVSIPACPDTRRADDILTPEQRAANRALALAAPPLTEEQRARLRPLLAGTIPARDADAAA